MDQLLFIFRELKERITGNSIQDKEEEELLEEIHGAWQEWVRAINYFQVVKDPLLVDHAVFMLGAAEAKYTYLLRRAKAQAVSGCSRKKDRQYYKL